MGSRQFHKTKTSVKLPKNVKKGNVVKAYSTSTDVIIEGFEGTIELINHSEVTKNMVLCRSNHNHQRKVWVQVRT